MSGLCRTMQDQHMINTGSTRGQRMINTRSKTGQNRTRGPPMEQQRPLVGWWVEKQERISEHHRTWNIKNMKEHERESATREKTWAHQRNEWEHQRHCEKIKENDDYHNVVIIAVSRRLCVHIVKSHPQPWRIRSKRNVFSWKKVLFSKADVW